ncbi:MAG: hypothetical protein ACK5O9_06820 [Holosporales bacterium]
MSLSVLLNLAEAPVGLRVFHAQKIIWEEARDDIMGSSEWLSHVVARLWPQLNPIERIIVHLGPGSYTGIRSALALAQGISLASGIPLKGITAEGYAALQRGETPILLNEPLVPRYPAWGGAA